MLTTRTFYFIWFLWETLFRRRGYLETISSETRLKDVANWAMPKDFAF